MDHIQSQLKAGQAYQEAGEDFWDQLQFNFVRDEAPRAKITLKDLLQNRTMGSNPMLTRFRAIKEKLQLQMSNSELGRASSEVTSEKNEESEPESQQEPQQEPQQTETAQEEQTASVSASGPKLFVDDEESESEENDEDYDAADGQQLAGSDSSDKSSEETRSHSSKPVLYTRRQSKRRRVTKVEKTTEQVLQKYPQLESARIRYNKPADTLNMHVVKEAIDTAKKSTKKPRWEILNELNAPKAVLAKDFIELQVVLEDKCANFKEKMVTDGRRNYTEKKRRRDENLGKPRVYKTREQVDMNTILKFAKISTQ